MASKDDNPPPKSKPYNEGVDSKTEAIVLSDEESDMFNSGETNKSDSRILLTDVTIEDSSGAANKNELTILSWNIDGLDGREIPTRIFGVSETIHDHSPDIIMFQEVTDETLTLLQRLSEMYDFTVYKVVNYYNIIMVKKDKALIQAEQTCIEFANSGMGRFLLIKKLIINGTSLLILTTHLESLASSSNKRKEQLRICFDSMETYMKKSNVIFCGDLNLREHELNSLGGPPQGISDAWEVSGCDINKKFTWDLFLNDNHNFGSSKPRARYDRMYYGSLKEKGINCSNFQLVGKQRLELCNLFPSDHFGLLVKFSL